MKRLARFGVDRPLLFGLVLIVAWSLLTAVTYPLRDLFPEGEVGQVLGDAAANLVISAALVGALWRFGWLARSGLIRWLDRRSWILVAVVGIYLVGAELFAFTGWVGPVTASSPLAVAQSIATLPGALMEELLFRGLALTAMLLAWGHTRTGVAKSVILSSLLFGATHLLNLLVRPDSVVVVQALVVSLPGILYGVLLLRTGSLWPAILIHWLTNAAVNVKIATMVGYEETGTMWLWFALFLIPIIAYSAYVLLTQRPVQTDSATGLPRVPHGPSAVLPTTAME